MKRLLITFLLTFKFITINAQDVITNENLQRTYFIKVGNNLGTAFVGIYKGKSYLITARHLFNDNPPNPKIFIYYKNGWSEIDAKVHFHSDRNVDVAVISTRFVSPNIKFIQVGPDSSNNVTFGDSGFFLGFPYGLYTEDKSHINSDYPLPVIKKAVLSGIVTYIGVDYYILDGLNNPGFSGGPIFFKNRQNLKDSIWHLIGVIKGYKKQYDSVNFKFKNSTAIINYVENSGIIYVTDSKYISQIIDKMNK